MNDRLNLLPYIKSTYKHEYCNFMLLHAIINNNSLVYLSERLVFILQISSSSKRQGDSLLSVPIHHTVKYNSSCSVSRDVTATNCLITSKTFTNNALGSERRSNRVYRLCGLLTPCCILVGRYDSLKRLS